MEDSSHHECRPYMGGTDQRHHVGERPASRVRDWFGIRVLSKLPQPVQSHDKYQVPNPKSQSRDAEGVRCVGGEK